MIPAVVRQLAAILATAGLLGVVSASASAADAPPRSVNLDAAGWQYAPDAADVGRGEGWADGHTGAGWRTVRLPHVFDPKPDPSQFSGTVGWYRLRLSAPRVPSGFAWGLRFEQARRVADVWIDGRPVAQHRDPYAPFTVTAPTLADGRPHEIVVRVDNHKAKEPREGWWNWGGLTRPVTLVPLGALVAHDAGFLPRHRCPELGGPCRWTVLVDTTIENRSPREITPHVAATLREPAGRVAGDATVPVRRLAPGESARVRFQIPVDGPIRLWGPGHPALYTATLRTAAGAAVQQVDTARIGLRTVAVRDGLLELNGRPVELRGASIQEDVDGHGPALTDADVDAIVAQLKAVGADVTRAHYALDERLARKLDEAGILVWSQAPIYHRDRLLETPAQRDAALATVRAAVLATRNHPSVITHSVANELSVIPDQVPGTRDFLNAARALTLDLDPTLPTSVDTLSYPGYQRQETYARFDLLGVNSYFGWYPGKDGHSTANLADFVPYVRQMRAWYPRAALVLTEFGAEATMTGPASEKQTFAFQASYTRDVLKLVDNLHVFSGAIYWTLREFAVKPDWNGGAAQPGLERDSIHHKGLITYDGRPKPAWEAMRDDILKTNLVRSAADVQLATGIRQPVDHRTRIGRATAIGVLLALLALVAVDLWAFFGWRRAVEAHEDDVLEAAYAMAAAGVEGDEDAERERPTLRLIA